MVNEMETGGNIEIYGTWFKLVYWGSHIDYHIYPLWQRNLSSLTATEVQPVEFDDELSEAPKH